LVSKIPWAIDFGNNLSRKYLKYMGTYISKNLIKTSVKLDRFGNVHKVGTFQNKSEEMKAKQAERAAKLGFKPKQ